MPVILGPDGPSLGGFVCPVTVVSAELWKMGQLRPDDRVRFRRIHAAGGGRAPGRAGSADRHAAARPRRAGSPRERSAAPTPVAARQLSDAGGRPQQRPAAIVYRRAGDPDLLIEYGPDWCSISSCACACTRLMRGSSGRHIAGHHRSDARASARCRCITTTARCRRRSCSTLLRRSKQSLPRESMTSRSPRASSSCRCPGTTRRPGWRSRNTCSRCARMRPGAPATSNSSAASTDSTAIDDVKRIVFEASYLVLGLGRRLPGRAGCHAARSAPPAGHHQIQSGAHLDAGERRRHRRRLSVRLRHGGARAATSSSAAPARCGTPSARRRNSQRASPGCCASSTRSASTRSARAELLEFRAGFRARPGAARTSEHDIFRLRRLPALPGRQRRRHRAPQGAPARRFRGGARRWEASGQIGYAAELPPPHDEGAEDCPGRTAWR